MTPLWEIAGLSVERDRRRLIEAADLIVRPGEVVGIVGPNGSGKTSLLRAGLGLWRAMSGVARLGGEPAAGLSPQERARRVGYLPQERRLAWNIPAWRAAALGAIHDPPALARSIALQALERVGLTPLAERGVFDMSGGERARVLLARLFATRAPLLVADEPTAGLDPDAQMLVLELLRGQARGGGAVALTLHDLTLAARSCDRLVVMHRGKVAAEGQPAEALKPATLAEVFGLDGALADTPSGPVLVARRRLEPA
jgi:iron complex transport system ATP-binding protein